ncbi:MAG: type II secretion system GspH family protein [Lachnospiraceae bacterium]|nr:type II secretion system GspH family protein [Lachnospiraceae bacterium]
MNKRNCQRKSILSSNKGFSLIELIVVIAIMAVAIGLVTITYSLVNNANVSKAANALDTAFNKARIQSMAKGTDAGQLTVWIDAGVMYYTIGDPDVETPIAVNSGVIGISYTDTNGVTFGHAEYMPRAIYRFNSAGMVIRTGPGAYLPREFEFSHGNRRVDVMFFLETGKHMTELN